MKDLNDALHALHKRAGYPAARKLQEMIGKEVFSYTKIHDALTKPFLPTRGVVELVVRELAKMARPPIGDIEAEVNRLVELWHAAHGDAPEAAPEIVSDRVEGPVDDPFDDPFEDMDGNADAREAAPGNPSGRAEAPNADLFDQFFRGEGAESQPKTPEDLANEVIKAAYKAHQGWVELDGHDAERSIDPFTPAEEVMAEEWLDYELRDRRAYRSDLANLKSALSDLALYHTIFLSEHPLRKELVSVIEQARQFRDQGGSANDQEGNERRAHTLVAAGRVYQTLTELKRLRPDPNQRRDLRILLAETIEQVKEIEAEGPRDEDGSRIWRGEWGALIQRLEVEALDIGDTDLRERIKEARVIMECHEEPFKQSGQQESRTRYIAAEYAMKSIEAFRDGDPFPEPPAEYVHTRDFVLDFIAEWEASRR